MIKNLMQHISDRLIKKHPKAASDPRSMKLFANWLLTYSSIRPKIVVEIGANYGQDAEGLRHYFKLKPQSIYVLEAHPGIYKELVKTYPGFNSFNIAAYNQTTKIRFNAIDVWGYKNSGVSSLLPNPSHAGNTASIEVDAIRMDEFLKKNSLEVIDVLKLDVEGASYEVLEGFGDELNRVKSIHIESEHIELGEGQRLFKDIERLLVDHNFELAFFERHKDQSDSVWIGRQYLLHED